MIPTPNDLEPCPYGCGRHVLVTLTDRGRRLAVDPDPHPGGNQAVWRTGTGAWRSRSLSGAEAMPVLAYEEIHMPHVATSPRCRPAPPAPALPGLTAFARPTRPSRLPRPGQRRR